MINIYWACLFFYVLTFVPFMNQHSAGVISGVVVFFLLSIWINKKQIKISRYVTGSMIILAMFLIYNQYTTFKGLEPGVGILAFLGILKTTELHSKRDFTLFLLIIELMLVGHLLTVDSLAMLVYVVFVTLCLFLLLLAFHRQDNWKKLEKEKIMIFLKIFVFSLPLAAVLFFLFPRLYMGGLFPNTIKNSGIIGFSNEVNPGDFAEIVADKSPVFRARFLNKVKPSYSNLYWRGAVLGDTDGFKWTKGRFQKKKNIVPSLSNVKSHYAVDFNSLSMSSLFLLEGTNWIKKISKGRLQRETGNTFKLLPYSNQKIRYEAKTSVVKYESLSKDDKQKYLAIPKGLSQRVLEYAKKLRKKYQNDEELMNAFLENYRKETFFYTLAPGSSNSDSKLDEFFFNKRKGYCEHYASATGVFFRLFGIPTRLVVGFQGGLFNTIGEYYLVRGRDAHAWVEIWNEKKKAWKRVDPTNYIAPDRIRLGAEAYFENLLRPDGIKLEDFLNDQNNTFLRKFFFAWDMLYFDLNRKFIGFDYDYQKDLLKRIGIIKNIPVKLMGVLLTIFSFFSIGIFLGIKYFDSKQNPIDFWYQKFCKKLETKGFVRESWRGPLSYRDLISPRIENENEVLRIFDMFISLKYAQNKEDLAQFKRLIKNIVIKKKSSSDKIS